MSTQSTANRTENPKWFFPVMIAQTFLIIISIGMLKELFSMV